MAPPLAGPFSPAQTTILAAAWQRVPEHGFTTTALAFGARDVGYLDVSVNLFPHAAFDLVHYHLRTQRLALADRARARPADGDDNPGAPAPAPSVSVGVGVGVGAAVQRLTIERLLGNRTVVHRWHEALAIMVQPAHWATSLAELARLSDEIWYLAGDRRLDSSWYTKRASLSAIYASAELYMTQDSSPQFAATREFVDRRMQAAQRLGTGVTGLADWLSFSGHAVTNVLRSKGAAI
ncbi:MAG: Ubiquinone biosynthesis protein coq9, mitochondrial [Phylliscum demangeonii]|nr:MAG: Ubiquinone biosynthesis protein coq9, mitochondrial [Phylliscum demangeonii]